MDDAKPFARLNLSIRGLGFILYSPFAVAHITDGDDYLQTHFWEPEAVAEHVNACTLTTFCTGSPGRFHLSLFDRSAPDKEVEGATMKLRLGIKVRGGVVCLRDLYDLMEWSAACPAEQQVRVLDGFYRLTVLSDPPASGVLGDRQKISIYFERMTRKPAIRWDGVPDLTPEDNAE